MQEIHFKHQFPIQIRFADIDKLGHVNNAIYHSYFELARVAYFDEIVGERVDWQRQGMILANANVNFKIPVRLGDQLTCYTKVSKVGNKSFELSNKLVITKDKEEHIAATATYVIVCMNYDTQQTIAVPESWKAAINSYEGTNF